MSDTPFNRRQLGRALSRAGRLTAAEALEHCAAQPSRGARRIGVTGPPGAGKSTLVARLAAGRASLGRRVGILAVDPTSPVSGGSILGDRIRMDESAALGNVYIRSVPSGIAQDGLSHNIAPMLDVFDEHDFDDVFLETVGVGQIDHAVRALVDTVALVVVPESGDTIQAMKAGILELADVYVVNKADRPHAGKMHAAIQEVVNLTRGKRSGWHPEVLLTTAQNGELGGLDAALGAHMAWSDEHADPVARNRDRVCHVLRGILAGAINEADADNTRAALDCNPRALLDHYLDTLNALR